MSSPTPAGTASSRLEIPPHLHSALQRLASFAYRRGKRGGWTAQDAPEVPADAVTQLAIRNLVKVRYQRRADRVEVTDLGLEVAAEIRASRRQALGVH